MSIKNFTVISQAIKNKSDGLIKYVKYLNNPKEKSHIRKNTNIIKIFNSSEKENDFIKKCCSEALSLDLKNQEAGKGGRPIGSYAISFDFILPKNTIRPTKEQWREITQDLFKELKNGIDEELSQDHFYSNIHDQDNPHINVLVSKVIGGKRSRKLDQKALLSKLKTQFNKSVLKHCNFDYKDYKPINENLGPRLQNWEYEKVLIDKAFKQFKTLCDYIENDNRIRSDSTKKRLLKTLQKLPEESQGKILNPFAESENKALKELSRELKIELKTPVLPEPDSTKPKNK
ncbi:TPA: hypothetical protein ACX6SI_003764 [Photobacterium damselae]